MIKLRDWQRKLKETTLEMLVSGGVLLVDDIKTELENISGGCDSFKEFLEGPSPGGNDRAAASSKNLLPVV